MSNESFVNSQIDNVNAFSQGTSPGDNIHKISINLHIPCCPELTPGQKIFLELARLGVGADIETGNIKGTDSHFEQCRVEVVEKVNNGNIAFLSGKLTDDCPEDSLCKKCVDAFNSVMSDSTKQYASEGSEIYGDFSNVDNNTII